MVLRKLQALGLAMAGDHRAPPIRRQRSTVPTEHVKASSSKSRTMVDGRGHLPRRFTGRFTLSALATIPPCIGWLKTNIQPWKNWRTDFSLVPLPLTKAACLVRRAYPLTACCWSEQQLRQDVVASFWKFRARPLRKRLVLMYSMPGAEVRGMANSSNYPFRGIVGLRRVGPSLAYCSLSRVLRARLG